MTQTEFRFGTCTVPDGKLGPWTIQTFTLSKEDVLLSNLRALRDNPIMYCPPGTYRRLTHKLHGLVMSNTPMEIATNMEAYIQAEGSVLINGLGMGMLLDGLLHKANVEQVHVIEIDAQLIKLVGKHYKNNPKVKITHADAYTYQPSKDERYDYIWHDIWYELDAGNFKSMAKLTRKWAGRSRLGQGVWSREELRAEMRRS